MNYVLLKLTKWHINLAKGKYVRTEMVELPNGKDQEIAIFSCDKPLYIGQCTPFRTIIIHEPVLNDKQLLNYVLLHEMGHKTQWWSIFILPLIFLVPASVFVLILAFVSLIQSMLQLNASQLLYFLGELILAGLLLLIPCAFSWAMELDAEFQAIKVIGSDSFLDIRNNLKKSPKPSKTFMVIARMTHPPTSVTIRCWKWLHKNKG
jgi:Zn-dependent protease with chaperone function